MQFINVVQFMMDVINPSRIEWLLFSDYFLDMLNFLIYRLISMKNMLDLISIHLFNKKLPRFAYVGQAGFSYCRTANV